jgi:hypothetical protein
VVGAGTAITPTASYYECDVTELIRAQRSAGAASVSLAVRMDRNVDHGPDTFGSRETATNRPQLVVQSTP